MSQPPPPPGPPPSGGSGEPQEPSSSHGSGQTPDQQKPDLRKSDQQAPDQQAPEQPRPDQQPTQLAKPVPPPSGQVPPPPPPPPPPAPGGQPGYGYPQPGGQPPQAPPPGGVFGAPTDPSYGYPQQGGQQPGQPYGYPQQGGQQPGQPYGYPQPPYGQPPYGQPPYGQPPQYGQYPAYPMSGAGAPPSGGDKSKLLIIVAAAVAVLLIAGGGIWFLASSGDEGTEAGGDTKGSSQGTTDGGEPDGGGNAPQKSAVELAWQTEAPDLSKSQDRIYEIPGTWFAGDNLVKVTLDAVVAYDRASGKAAWSIEMVRGPRCTATPEASGDRALVQWGRKCEKVMAIDLAEGKELWRKDLPTQDRGAGEYDYAQMAVSGDTAAVAWIGNAVGYDLASGKQLWEQERGAECQDRGYVGGARLLAHIECGFGDSESIQAVKADGSKDWQWEAPGGVEIKRIFSVDPVVIGVEAGGGFDITDIMVLDDKGKLRTKIGLPEKRYRTTCSGIALAGCHNVVVDKDNDQLYLQTEMHQGDGAYGRVNEVAAFGLDDGKAKWLAKPTKERETSPLTMADGKLLGYEKPTYEDAGKITSIDPATGKTSLYVSLPEQSRDIERDMTLLGDGRPYWHEGGLYLVVQKFYKDASLNKGGIAAFN